MTRYNDLADLIRSFRFSAKWTQSELAERAGIALMSVSAVEQGRNTRWETLNSIAQAFGYDSFIDLCRAGVDPLHAGQTQALLRAWDALPDEQARMNALALIAAEVVKLRYSSGH